MTRYIVAGALLGVLAFVAFVLSLPFAGPADARGLHPRCNIDWPCVGASDHRVKPGHETRMSKREARRIARGQRLEQAMPFGAPIYPPETQRSFLSGAPRYISGRLKCAVNVGAALAARGIRGTGSALAKSYLHWGRPSGPQPGAVAVFSRGRRGGHVAIVDSVRPDGTVIYLNPSSRRQAWQVGPYNRRPIAFRAPS